VREGSDGLATVDRRRRQKIFVNATLSPVEDPVPNSRTRRRSMITPKVD
jgi:hypothetical protein